MKAKSKLNLAISYYDSLGMGMSPVPGDTPDGEMLTHLIGNSPEGLTYIISDKGKILYGFHSFNKIPKYGGKPINYYKFLINDTIIEYNPSEKELKKIYHMEENRKQIDDLDEEKFMQGLAMQKKKRSLLQRIFGK